ncbi:MAG: TatD family hydrolase [Gaiellaceae bacterium]
MIDTHAHLDHCEGDPAELVARAAEAGVEAIVTIGTGLASCRAVLEIAAALDPVWAAVGIDTHKAGRPDADDPADLGALTREPKVVAVGETGLDYHYGADVKAEQRALFEAQLAIAADAHLPVVIHCREAAADTADVLAGFPGTVVLHCFSEPELLQPAIDRGYYLSFAGNVTYGRSGDLREAARAVPSERLLAETDSPYLSPQPVRGSRNEPANVVHTVAALAAARGEDAAELGARTAANARAAFGLQ